MEPQSKILYIDDEEDNLVVFRSTFRGLFQVLTATSGMAGLTLLDEHPDVKLVITDQRMPQMSGVQFLEKLIPRHPAPTRIVLTGYTDINDIVNAINHGKIYHYVSKPWSKDSLKLVIDKGIEHFHLRKRNEELVYTLQEKNEKLLAAIDELELFLYRSSHDLRGPIASISGLINLVKLQPDSPENGSHIARIESQIAKLERTIQKLGKINATNLSQSHTEDTVVDHVVAEIIGNHRSVIDAHNISLTTHANDTQTVIRTNRELMMIAIECVIENAIQFSRQSSQPSISIDWSRSPSSLRLTVRDNGIGMTDDVIQKIFDPFFRGVDISTGNGLGLYMAKKAISKVQGTIHVVSTPGKGSTFSMEIPVHPAR